MAIEVLVVGRGGIGRSQYREEFGHEIDEHGAEAAPIWEDVRSLTMSLLVDTDLTFRRRPVR